MAVIALDRGHVGRSGGAGASCGALREDILTREYMRHAEDALRAAGHEVILLCHGTYPSRQAWAADVADIYVAAHVNAGAGTYGLIGHDHRSTMGAKLAVRVAEALGKAWPGVLTKTTVQPSKPDDWTNHMFNLVKGLYAGKPCGIVFEPGFIDSAAHAQMWTPLGLEVTGRALASGITAWLGSRA